MDTQSLKSAALIFLLGSDNILRVRHEIDNEIMGTAAGLLDARPEGARNMYLRMANKSINLAGLRAVGGEPTEEQQDAIDAARLCLEELQLVKLASSAVKEGSGMPGFGVQGTPQGQFLSPMQQMGQMVPNLQVPQTPVKPISPSEQLRVKLVEFMTPGNTAHTQHPPGQYFNSHQEAVDALISMSREAGFGISCNSTEYEKDNPVKTLRTAKYRCDRGSYKYKEMPEELRQRKKSTRQTGCPFRASITHLTKRLGKHAEAGMQLGQWALTFQHLGHNHEMSKSPAAHPCHRKLTQAQKEIIHACMANGMKPSKIAKKLKEDAEEAGQQFLGGTRDVYNEVRKWKAMHGSQAGDDDAEGEGEGEGEGMDGEMEGPSGQLLGSEVMQQGM